MRTNFMRNHKKVRDAKNKCSGSGTDDFYKPTWPLYDSLMFLEKTCAQVGSCSNLDSQASHENAESAILSNIYMDDNLQQWMMIPKDVGTVPSVPHTDIVSPDESDVSCSGYLTTAIASSQRSSSSVPSVSENVQSPLSPASKLSEGIPFCPISILSFLYLYLFNSIPLSGKRPVQENILFTKRGAKCKRITCLEEAAEAMVRISEQNIPPPPPPPLLPPLSPSPKATQDDFDHFGMFVAARLREIKPERAEMCEVEIVKILCKPAMPNPSSESNN